MYKEYFEGYYFKHFKDGKTIAFIPVKSASGSFIQVITDEKTYNFNVPAAKMGKTIVMGDCVFTANGIEIQLPNIKGKIAYKNLTPIKYDIMGPFKFFPMECTHGVVSMGHNLCGGLTIDGIYYDFTDGIGYIEKDSGCSFPEKYLWLQANNFDNLNIMLSIAKIPFYGLNFDGCICDVIFKGKEYRLATYLGCKACIKDNRVIIKQGVLILVVDILSKGMEKPLASPICGQMSGIIHETNNAKMRFRLYKSKQIIFDKKSRFVSFERHLF
ncbi:MAG: tocopherol cyclase family protein [Oscillospiraceae bacterium]